VRGAFSHDQDEEGETTNQESPKAKSTEGPRTSTGTTTTLEETKETPKSQKPPKETAPQMETILREERKPEKISERETLEEAGGELEPKSFDEEQKVPVDRDTVREKIKKDEAEEEAKREREIQEEPAETISKNKDDAIVKERATSDSLAEFGQAKYQESDSSGGSESTLLGDDVKPAKNSLPSRVREDVPDPDPKKDVATYTLVEGNEVTKPIRPKPKFAAKAYETPLPVPKMNTPRPPPESTTEGQFGKIDAEYDGTNSAGAAEEILPTKDEKPKDIKSVPLHVEENSDASTKKIVSELKEAVAAVEKVIEEESEKIVHGASQAITDIEEYVEAGGTSRKEEESRSNSILNDSALSRQQIAEPSAPASSSTTEATTMTASTTEEDKTNGIQQVDLNRRASLFRKNEPSPPSNDPDVASFITTKSGLQFQILKDGSGPKPYPGASVDTSYVGYLNGFGNERLQFDAAKHFSFQVGNGEVIAGWDEAFLDMREGEQRRLIIPSSLAYGSAGAGGIIPPDATLYFQVELLSMSTKGVKQNKK